jgi:hypothetical protein
LDFCCHLRKRSRPQSGRLPTKDLHNSLAVPQMRLPHLSRFSKGGRHEPQPRRVPPLQTRWASRESQSPHPRNPPNTSSEVTLRKSRRVGQPQWWRRKGGPASNLAFVIPSNARDLGLACARFAPVWHRHSRPSPSTPIVDVDREGHGLSRAAKLPQNGTRLQPLRPPPASQGLSFRTGLKAR